MYELQTNHNLSTSFWGRLFYLLFFLAFGVSVSLFTIFFFFGWCSFSPKAIKKTWTLKVGQF